MLKDYVVFKGEEYPTDLFERLECRYRIGSFLNTEHPYISEVIDIDKLRLFIQDNTIVGIDGGDAAFFRKSVDEVMPLFLKAYAAHAVDFVTTVNSLIEFTYETINKVEAVYQGDKTIEALAINDKVYGTLGLQRVSNISLRVTHPTDFFLPHLSFHRFLLTSYFEETLQPTLRYGMASFCLKDAVARIKTFRSLTLHCLQMCNEEGSYVAKTLANWERYEAIYLWMDEVMKFNDKFKLWDDWFQESCALSF